MLKIGEENKTKRGKILPKYLLSSREEVKNANGYV